MGIAKSAFKLLLEEGKRTGFQGKKVLQLGRQHTFFPFSTALSLAQKAKYPYRLLDGAYSSPYVDDITLFSLLGFSEVHSLDVSSYEKSSFIHDLNEPIPPHLQGQYDLIFDGGTLEHVFNVPQVFRNIHRLLKTGGRIIHCSPSHNHVDHGFYMFSPTLFHDYYSANSYAIQTSYIFEYSLEHNTPWKVFEYKPGCLDALSFGGFGKKMLGIWFVAQKRASSTEGIVPQQSACRRQWIQALEKREASFLKNWLKRSEWLRFFVYKMRKKISQFKARRSQLKQIGLF